MRKLTSMSLLLVAVAVCAQPAYLDTSLSFEERAADLVSRMTLQEKIDQLGRNTKAVPRLGVERYDFWNEALHGIQNGTGEGTSFPMPLSLSVTWDEESIRAVASAIADECRGHNQPLDEGGRGRGLTYWCPTIDLAPLNCARDSALVAYAKPGEWMTLVHEVPVAKLPGEKLTRFEAYIFNDTGKYAPEPPDGIAWNNDTGVKMTVRNVQVLTDRPAR